MAKPTLKRFITTTNFSRNVMNIIEQCDITTLIQTLKEPFKFNINKFKYKQKSQSI